MRIILGRALCIFCFFVSYLASSQTCLPGFNATLQTDVFVDNGDGTATDTFLGLVWMRCSLGQTWSNETCSGDPSELTWQQALQAAHGFEYA